MTSFPHRSTSTCFVRISFVRSLILPLVGFWITLFVTFPYASNHSWMANANEHVVDDSRPTKRFRSTDSDRWAGIDGLSRHISTAPGTPQNPLPLPRSGRCVGMFYFVWMNPQTRTEPFFIEEILQAPPDQRKWGPVHAFHWWGRPRFGFYHSHDRWVMRQHAFLLNDLGVDVILIDVTNALTYDEHVRALFETWNELQQEGQKTPQIAFLANSHARQTVQHLMDQWYLPKRFPELWFRWHEKPLLLMPLDDATQEMREYFEIRHSWAWTRGQKWFGNGQHRWPWLDHTPQGFGWSADPMTPEQISVSVAEHPVSNIGRSFSQGRQPPEKDQKSLEGLHFREQWQRAHEIDPEFILITGWNEWIAQRFLSEGGQPFLGRPTQKGETFFVDQFSAEFSRDIEPAAGPLSDHYYYQTMAEIRRFKGARVPYAASVPHNIMDPSQRDDWQKVEVRYLDDLNDALVRNSSSWVFEAPRLTQSAASVDIESSAVGFDGTSYWVQSTFRPSDEKASRLSVWLDLDGQLETGPCGFESVAHINTAKTGSGQTVLYSTGNISGKETIREPESGTIPVTLETIVSKESAAIRLNTELLQRNKDGRVQFRWKWHSPPAQEADSSISLDHPFIAGDSAPNGRLGYLYGEQKRQGKPQNTAETVKDQSIP